VTAGPYAQRVPAIEITPVPWSRLDELEPLWRELYERHNAVTPHLSERVRPFAQAWASRRNAESRWQQAEPDSFVLAAHFHGRLAGYAFVRVRSGAGFAESWTFSDPIGDLVTLVVLPELRGQGIGSALLDAVEARLHELGIADLVITVIATNTDAARLYERRGAVPFITDLVQRVRGPEHEGEER
jgi:ribosomal protein S18 acetylase RimI-like enzyme